MVSVSHDDLMNFMEKQGTIPHASNVLSSGASLSEVSLSMCSELGDGISSNCVDGASFSAGTTSSNRKAGGGKIKSECLEKSYKHCDSAVPVNSDYASISHSDGSGLCASGLGSSEGRGKVVNKPAANDIKMKKIKPTFVPPPTATPVKKLSPRSQLLKDLRFHKNIPKSSFCSSQGENIDIKNDRAAHSVGAKFSSIPNLGSGIDATNRSFSHQNNKKIIFARKSKVESVPTTEISGIENDAKSKSDNSSIEQSFNEQEPNLKKRFACEKCPKKYSYFQSLKTHKLKGQCDKEIICNQCDKKFSNTKNLKCHVMTSHIKPRYQCGVCFKMFPTQKTVDAHLKHYHVKRECTYCKKLFKNSNTLRSHIHWVHKKSSSGEQDKITIDKSKQLLGGEAGSSYSVSPVEAASKTDRFEQECDHCGIVFKSRSGYRRHMLKHKDISVSESVGGNIEVTTELCIPSTIG